MPSNCLSVASGTIFFELLAFFCDLFEEFFCGAVFGVLFGEFAADCGLQQFGDGRLLADGGERKLFGLFGCVHWK